MINQQSVPRAPEPVSVPPIRILLVDDHGIVRAGIATLLERNDGIKVVGSAATGEEAVQATGRLKPDIVVMDLVLPGLNGIDATGLILDQFPDTLVIVLSSLNSSAHVRRALGAGARGYVLKSGEGIELMHAIKSVTAGGQYISPAITGMNEPRSGHDNPFDLLSPREQDVLRRVLAGHTSVDIGRQLSLSPKTIETYRGRFMLKLGVNDRAELIRLSMDFEVPPV